MSIDFLPEEDRAYLDAKGYAVRGEVEQLPDNSLRRGVIFSDFDVPHNLERVNDDGSRTCGGVVELLIVIPAGYPVVKLDSWYVSPVLCHPGGAAINCATGTQDLFGETWQFWSRHLTNEEWAASDQGLESYMQYVRDELRAPS